MSRLESEGQFSRSEDCEASSASISTSRVSLTAQGGSRRQRAFCCAAFLVRRFIIQCSDNTSERGVLLEPGRMWSRPTKMNDLELDSKLKFKLSDPSGPIRASSRKVTSPFWSLFQSRNPSTTFGALAVLEGFLFQARVTLYLKHGDRVVDYTNASRCYTAPVMRTRR